MKYKIKPSRNKQNKYFKEIHIIPTYDPSQIAMIWLMLSNVFRSGLKLCRLCTQCVQYKSKMWRLTGCIVPPATTTARASCNTSAKWTAGLRSKNLMPDWLKSTVTRENKMQSDNKQVTESTTEKPVQKGY